MNYRPTVSVVTPLFNNGTTIGATLKSVLDQTFDDWECLVVDDGSSDRGPTAVAGAATRDARIKPLRNECGKGPAGARNTGIKYARGRYIAFLDSDDTWYPEKLATQVAFMQQTGAILSYTAFVIVSTDGKRRQLRSVPTSLEYQQLLRWNCIGCLTVMYDQDALGKQYMPAIRMRQDWGLWLKLLRISGVPALGINKPLAELHLRKGSLSSNKLKSTWYNFKLLYRVERLGFVKSLWCVASHALQALRS